MLARFLKRGRSGSNVGVLPPRTVVPAELFDEAWQILRDNFYQPERIQDWDGLRRGCLAQIETLEDAKQQRRVLIRCLADRWTSILDEPFTVNPNARASARRLGDGIAYLGIHRLDNHIEDLKELMDNIGPCRGLVVDLRNNGGGDTLTTAYVLSGLIEDGLLWTYEQRDFGGKKNVEYWLVPEGIRIVETFGSGSVRISLVPTRLQPQFGKVPIAVLVNRQTVSCAELAAKALEIRRLASTIGETTAGKALGQSCHVLMDGESMMVSSSVVRNADGTWLGDGSYSAEGMHPRFLVEPNPRLSDDWQLLCARMNLLVRHDPAGAAALHFDAYDRVMFEPEHRPVMF